MNLYMFQFGDRPYGGRFIAVVHNSEAEALDVAVKLAHPHSTSKEKDYRRWHMLGVDNTGVPVEIGAWVDGSHEE